jgi:hypothetical protein
MIRVFFIICIFIVWEAKSQQTYPPNLFIGEWFYQGSENSKVYDTICLTRKSPGLTYTKWEFSENHGFNSQIYVRSTGLTEIFTEDKKVDDRWFFNNINNQLKIEKASNDLVFRVISYDESDIKIVRIE